jgi:hypothetical protein
MTAESNQEWLTNLKPQDKSEQLAMVRERFFMKHSVRNDSVGMSLFSPVLVIDGIPILESLTENAREQLYHLLSEDSVKEIAVLDKEPEQLYVNKRWTGIIAVVLSDKKASRKLKKIDFYN